MKRAAFTLVELLVVIAIIGILISLVMPVIGKALQRAKTVQCMSNLKQVGTLVIGSSGMAHNNIYLYSMNDSATNTWATHIVDNEENNDIFVCPGFQPFSFSSLYKWMLTYGIRMDSPVGVGTESDNINWLHPLKVDNPSDYHLVADSLSLKMPVVGAQFCQFQSQGDPNHVVHARHLNKADIAFLDGHVESCGRKRLDNLGIEANFSDPKQSSYYYY